MAKLDVIDFENENQGSLICIECSADAREQLAELLVDEYTQMLLNGMGLGDDEISLGDDPWDVEYRPISHESDLFLKAKHTVINSGLCKVSIRDNGVQAELCSVDDAAFVLADEINNGNSYIDGFGNDDSSMVFVASKVKKAFPAVSINAAVTFQGNGYGYIEYVQTKNGKMKIWNSEDDEKRIIK